MRHSSGGWCASLALFGAAVALAYGVLAAVLNEVAVGGKVRPTQEIHIGHRPHRHPLYDPDVFKKLEMGVHGPAANGLKHPFLESLKGDPPLLAVGIWVPFEMVDDAGNGKAKGGKQLGTALAVCVPFEGVRAMGIKMAPQFCFEPATGAVAVTLRLTARPLAPGARIHGR